MLVALASVLFGSYVRADRIILRDVTILTNVTVESFDVEGVLLSDGRALTWDVIDRATIAEDQQAAFNERLKQLGEPLFRLRGRLQSQDYGNLPAAAEPLAPLYERSSSDTALMVYQALAWGRAARGERAAAVAPTLHVWRILSTRPDAAASLPGRRRPTVDPTTGLDPTLPPVWHPSDNVAASLAPTFATIRLLPRRPEAAFLYYASLQIAGGQTEEALALLSAMPTRDAAATQLAEALRLAARTASSAGESAAAATQVSAGELAQFAVKLPGWSAFPRSVGLYYLGKTRLGVPDAAEVAQQGAVDLMTIPALYGDASPELAAQAMADVMAWYESRNQSSVAVRLRKELLGRFAGTSVAARLRGTP